MICNCSAQELADYYENHKQPETAQIFKTRADKERIKLAAVKSLHDDYMAVLHGMERGWKMTPERIGEATRRADMYLSVALNGG